MSIKISCESTINVPEAYREKYDITVLPMHIVYNEESFDDNVNINPETVIRRFEETGDIPSSSACSIGEYDELFKKLCADGNEVIHFSMSSDMSSTYRNACIAAENFDNVYVIDTKNFASGAGLAVIKCAELREKGFSAKEIVRVAKELVGKIRSGFILESLSFLAKGGRCPAVVAFGANILGIKPTIFVENGKMSVGKKFRGKFDSCIIKYVDDLLENCNKPDLSRVCVEYSYGITEQQIETVKREIKKYYKFDEILVAETNTTIVTHCGKNTIAVMFLDA